MSRHFTLLVRSLQYAWFSLYQTTPFTHSVKIHVVWNRNKDWGKVKGKDLKIEKNKSKIRSTLICI